MGLTVSTQFSQQYFFLAVQCLEQIFK